MIVFQLLLLAGVAFLIYISQSKKLKGDKKNVYSLFHNP